MNSRVCVIDYGSGNLRSVAKALGHIADDTPITISADPAELQSATHIILPGVGAFGDCIKGLNAIQGMRDALEREVRERKKWFLGICVGMQLLFERGHEHGIHDGLGWIGGEVVKLEAGALKIPHMGWNTLAVQQPHALLAGIASGDHAYFVHSYHARCKTPGDVLAATDYGQSVTAVVAHENIMGTQFHPEKSQETGLRLLKNFIAL